MSDLARAEHQAARALAEVARLRHGAGRRLEAADTAVQAAALAPRDPYVRFMEAWTLHEAGRLAEAEAAYRALLAIDPSHASGWYNLGNVMRDTARPAEAARCYRNCLQHRPDHAGAPAGLIEALREQGKHREARELATAAAVEGAPAELAIALGNLAAEEGRHEEAVAAFDRALAQAPLHVGGLVNRANALLDRGRVGPALDGYGRAVVLSPAHPGALTNLGNARKDRGEVDQAARWYARALTVQPDSGSAASNLLLTLNYDPAVGEAALAQRHRAWGRRFAEAAPAPLRDPDPDRRLRVGFVSPDLGRHPVGYFLERVWPALEAERYAYSDRRREDPLSERLKACSIWRPIAGLSDAAVAEQVRADGIDILVDLAGHTAGNRLGLFARRSAPVQVAWLGYPHTTGLAAIDWHLTDAWTVPEGGEQHFVERVMRLPGGRFCYAPPEAAPEVADRTGKPLTFGSFNNLAKLSPAVIALWASILIATPDSRLVLKWRSLADAGVRERILGLFRAEGVAPERIDLRGASPHPEMLAEYGDIDIALDPFPFGGGLTSCEALWMGVPVVTLRGERPAGNQTTAFLAALGLDDLSSESPVAYRRVALALASNPVARLSLRRVLRQRMAASRLCDGPAFARELAYALRSMWDSCLRLGLKVAS